MDLHQYLPPHAHHHVDRENHHMSTWTTPNGTWQVILSPHLGRTHVSGPGPISIIRAGGIDEDQVVALLRLLEAIDPAPRRTVATEELITDLQQHLDDNHDPYSGPLTSHDAARIMISWLQQAGDGQAMARILTERARDQKAVRDRLSATHSPETHELDLRHSENSDSPTAP